MSDYHGACHCGALELTYSSEVPPAEAKLIACQCRFCRKRGALAVSDPNGRLDIRVNDPEQLQRYRFGLRTADYLICRNCGVYIAALVHEGERSFGIAMVPALDGAEAFTSVPVKADYSGEEESARRQRRLTGWTPASVALARA